MAKSVKVQANDEIKSEDHNSLVEDIVALESAIEKIPAGPEGKQGPKGETGPQGPAGKDSEVTKQAFDELAARVTALEGK